MVNLDSLLIFLCVVFLLCETNLLFNVNFDVLKYIKKYLKYQHSVYLMINRE